MARTYARLPLRVLQDDAFRALTRRAFALYVLLLLQPDLKPCGVLGYAPRRWTGALAGGTVDGTMGGLTELIERGFVVIDEATEEVWLPRFVEDDGIVGQPASAKAALDAGAQVSSDPLRRQIAERQGPTLLEAAARAYRGGASNGSGRRPIDSQSRARMTGSQSTDRQGDNRSTDKAKGKESTSSSSRSTSPAATRKARRAATEPPDNMLISETMRDWAKARAPDIDLPRETERLLDWARGTGARKVDWIATWRNWMRTAQEDLNARPRGRRPATARLSAPGMPPPGTSGTDLVTTYMPTGDEPEILAALPDVRARRVQIRQWLEERRGVTVRDPVVEAMDRLAAEGAGA